MKIWNPNTAEELRTLEGPEQEIISVAFSPDGKRLVAGGNDKLVYVWDMESGRLLFRLSGHAERVTALSFAPDGRKFATASQDRTIKIWEAESGREIRVLKGHTDYISSVAFSHDGRRIVSSSWDHTVRIWDVESGLELVDLVGHSHWVMSAVFSPDDRSIVSGSADTTARLWSAASVDQVKRWREAEQLSEQRMARHHIQRESLVERRRKSFLSSYPEGITNWLILAPFVLPENPGANAQAYLDRDFLPNEKNLRPKAGDSCMMNGTTLSWREENFMDGTINFNKSREPVRSALGYAVTYLWSDKDQSVLLESAIDDYGQIYVNGQPVCEKLTFWLAVLGNDTVEVNLKKGMNVIAFKIINAAGQWYGQLWFSDRDGNPVKGLRAGTNPDYQEE